jgi:hypothetical protein
MTEIAENTGQRDRSPAYPNITLKAALDRLTEFDTHFKRSPARAEKVGDAWGIKGKAYVDRTAAALRYFGFLEYQGSGKDRQIIVSDEGRKYLRAQQEETKREVVKAAALRPKQIAKFWSNWGTGRPADAACIDELVFKNSFSDKGAKEFLRIYDATISYAGLVESDKVDLKQGEISEEEDTGEDQITAEFRPKPPANSPSTSPQGKVKLMDGERIVFTEESNPQSYLKLIASGDVDETMLEALEDYVKRQKKRLSQSTAQRFGRGPDEE